MRLSTSFKVFMVLFFVFVIFIFVDSPFKTFTHNIRIPTEDSSYVEKFDREIRSLGGEIHASSGDNEYKNYFININQAQIYILRLKGYEFQVTEFKLIFDEGIKNLSIKEIIQKKIGQALLYFN